MPFLSKARLSGCLFRSHRRAPFEPVEDSLSQHLFVCTHPRQLRVAQKMSGQVCADIPSIFMLELVCAEHAIKLPTYLASNIEVCVTFLLALPMQHKLWRLSPAVLGPAQQALKPTDLRWRQVCPLSCLVQLQPCCSSEISGFVLITRLMSMFALVVPLLPLL